MVRSLTAVLAGYIVVACLVVGASYMMTVLTPALAAPAPGGSMPGTAYLVINLAYAALFAFFGGYITATLAGRAPVWHAVALAALFAAAGVIGAIRRRPGASSWYVVSLVAIAGPAAVLGSVARARRRGVRSMSAAA